MTPQETAGSIAYINKLWPRRPLGLEIAPAWHRHLAAYDAKQVAQAIDSLVGVSDWPPGLSHLVRILTPEAKGELAAEAFQSVLLALHYAPADRRDRVSPQTAATVRALGGWGVIGQWDRKAMSFHQKDFNRVFEDMNMREQDNKRLGIKPAEHKALPPLPGDKPEGEPVAPERLRDMLAGAMKRIGGGA